MASPRIIREGCPIRIRKQFWVLFLLLCAALVLVGAPNTEVIKQSGFADFAQGTLGNSGANLYVSRNGQIQVINRWDLNNDGHVDVLISNDHDVVEIIDAFLYSSKPDGFHSVLPPLWKERPVAQIALNELASKESLNRLPAFGGGRSVIADVNRDGYPEIVFCNYIHNYPGVRTAFLYWGSASGYDVAHRTELPTNWAAGVAAADLNADGYPELVFANQGVEPGSEEISPSVGHDSFVYWGSATGFSTDRRSLLPTPGARDVTVADINRDGYQDLAFITSSLDAKTLTVFWGSATGYSGQKTQSIKVPDPTSVRSADLNNDGYADVVVTTAAPMETIGFEGSARPDSSLPVAFVFFGDSQGLRRDKAVQLPTHAARGSCIGDFNKDGFQDIAIANASEGSSAKTDSFVYWGSGKGFSVERRAELPTLGASAVAAGDFNHDGNPDLIFANSNDGDTYDVPSYIYWGASSGFAPYRRAELQSFGAADVNSADVNGDGQAEILLVNQYSGHVKGKVNTHLFWGNAEHEYSVASMTDLPGSGTYDTTTADLNCDGWPDVVLSNSVGDASYIYWGNKERFSTQRRTDLPITGAFGSSAADLNRDGYLDLVFTHRVDGKHFGTVFWGGADGYSSQHRLTLALKGRRSLSNIPVDLNRDGFLDLLFSDEYFGILHIFWGGRDGFSESRSWSKFVSGGGVELADLNGDGLLDFVVAGGFDPQTKSRNTKTRIFFGTAEGLPALENPIELDAFQSLECSIADLNRDGNLDLVLSNYMSDTTRALPLFIYWGGPSGRYSNQHRTDLPAESSAGIQTVDLNRDGYPEIIVHNHLKNGDHSIDSYIYWNSPKGFDKNRRTGLPTFGPHFSQMTDPGNLYSRKLEEEYFSAPLAIPPGKKMQRLLWKGTEPHGAKLRFQVRSAATRDGLNHASWLGSEGESSFYEVSGTELMGGSIGHTWLQYRAVFTSPDGGEWPTLSEVELAFR